jgi:hypothetical protein
MTPQTPAQGILVHRDYGDAKHYSIMCECTSTDHMQNVWIEAEDAGVTVTIYTQQKSLWWGLNRWQIIWKLLTKGYIETEVSTIMNEQQALNYSQALRSAVNDVAEFRKQKKVKASNKEVSKLAEQGDCV